MRPHKATETAGPALSMWSGSWSPCGGWWRFVDEWDGLLSGSTPGGGGPRNFAFRRRALAHATQVPSRSLLVFSHSKGQKRRDFRFLRNDRRPCFSGGSFPDGRGGKFLCGMAGLVRKAPRLGLWPIHPPSFRPQRHYEQFAIQGSIRWPFCPHAVRRNALEIHRCL